MLISRKSKILAASVLAIALAACTTKRTAGTDADAAATGGGAQSGAIGADASAANVGGGIDSQSLGGGAGGSQAGAAGSGAPLSVRVVRFDYDSADLQQEAYPVLQAHAAYLRSNASARLAIGGHTDERGTREYNMALGERRAKTVATFLQSNGAKASQLEVVSFGEEKPVSMDSSEAGWAENRRAELNYTVGQPKP